MEPGTRTPPHFLRGMALSALLHGVVLLLALLLWEVARSVATPADSGPQPIPVDLVAEGAQTASPDGAQSRLPQERATEAAEHPQPQAVPVPKQAAPVQAPGKRAPHKDQDHAQPDPHRTPNPQPQAGEGVSNTTTGAALNGHAAYGVKDYVRAQIERRWYPQGSALLRNDWVVQLHLELDENGGVEKAEIVDGGKMSDAAYRDFAFSVRNAALLSAPFALPPGLDDAARDMTLNFNPRQVQQ